MLVNLHVKNLALLKEAEVEFGPGLNILTGETGAGKSILIGSINLALGARLDKDFIRNGEESALVELLFLLQNEQEKEMIRQLDIPIEDDNLLLIQRRLQAGKSVCRVNGMTLQTKQIKEVAEVLLDLHGQHEHQSLLHAKKHREIVDTYIGKVIEDLQESLRCQREEYLRVDKEIQEAYTDEEQARREYDYLQYLISELEAASLVPGEDVSLEADYQRMLHMQKIVEVTEQVVLSVGGGGQEGMSGEIGRALHKMRSVTAYDSSMETLYDQLKQIEDLMADFQIEIARYVSDAIYDAGEMTAMEERLNLLNRLKQKHATDMEGLFTILAQHKKRCYELEHFREMQEQKEIERDALLGKMNRLCAQIHTLRSEHAIALRREVMEALSDLNFEQVQFEISLEEDPEHIYAHGYDKVEFMISTNPGEKLKQLAGVASGGELSRIMLAIKSVLARQDHVGTLIFDEIDAGISGKTAWKVAQRLEMISRDHQVICITHLPQIAAMAEWHYLINKVVCDGSTETQIHRLTQEQMTQECARLLGGDRITEAVLENARDLRNQALEQRKNGRQ